MEQVNSFKEEPSSVFTDQRSEEVEHIIERAPTKFGSRITILILGIFFSLLFFGWKVSYPDVVTGEMTINSSHSPIKLYSLTSGKIKMLVKSQQEVRAHDFIGYIQNSADFRDINTLNEQLSDFNPILFSPKSKHDFDSKLKLGELTGKYYLFINAVTNYYLYQTDSLASNQLQNINAILSEEKRNLVTNQQQVQYNKRSVELYHKIFTRDSLIFKNKYESESDFERVKVNLLTAMQAYNSSIENLRANREKVDNAEGQIQQLKITNFEKGLSLKLALTSSHNDLLDGIKLWNQKYAIIAPIEGKVQYLKFWADNQFVQPSEEICTVVPKNIDVIGQLILPESGAGKVQIGQEVVIKLNDYPYREYGTLKGKISSISLTTGIVKGKDQAEVPHYLVSVDLPKGLQTNYGTKLPFKYELKGSAEIITRERRLGFRLFDNLNNYNQRN